MLVKVRDGLHVNAAYVIALEWVCREGSPGVLTIRMHDGKEYAVVHEPYYMGGADAYAVEREILAAQKCGQQQQPAWLPQD